MATLYITEFKGAAQQVGERSWGAGPGVVSFAAQPPLAEQTVAIAGSSAQSNALSANTYLVRVSTDAICSVLFGSNPTATTASARMAAGQTEYFGVAPGMKVAVISNT
jgi:hypothetical protein